jgi:hypothetical protein
MLLVCGSLADGGLSGPDEEQVMGGYLALARVDRKYAQLIFLPTRKRRKASSRSCLWSRMFLLTLF